MRQANMAMQGRVGMRVIRAAERHRRAPWTWLVQNWLAHRLPDVPRLYIGRLARLCGVPIMESRLFLVVTRVSGETEDYGLVSTRVVTTAGVGAIVDAFQNSVELETLKYHGLGTGTNAEASGDTALQTELTTQYSTDNTRATGTTTEGASANIYRTVGTVTVDASAAVTEHGIFSQAATGGGTLLDRSVFSAINLANGDSLQATYELTLTAGS